MRRAIFWDSDGTLMFGNESFAYSMIKVCKQFGCPVEEQKARALMRRVCSWYAPEADHSTRDAGQWWDDLLSEIAAFCRIEGLENGRTDMLCEAFRRNVIDFEYRLYDDTKSILAYFSGIGYENYILSNNFPELGQVFDRLGAGVYLKGCFTSASLGYEKPRAEAFRLAMQRAGSPDICYMIGDNPVTDYQGGMCAGMRPILFRSEPLHGEIACKNLSELRERILP